ncbi:dTDP-4-dehydrorhamnose 3,5-epimerase family protein [Vibrio taketomensis]|uniref:dTDP-4-dehydrorhamnose 3,5-epimerase family protein n=1 Tax=Vibrio taketomensis TaxID=2572923 RepID=UPI00138A4790
MRNHWLYLMNVTQLDISGCYLIELPKFEDYRGAFIKTYHPNHFEGTPFPSLTFKKNFTQYQKERSTWPSLSAPPAAQ